MSEAFKTSYLPNSPKVCTEEKGEQLKLAASFPFSEVKHTIAHRDVCICTRHFRNLRVLLHRSEHETMTNYLQILCWKKWQGKSL